MVSGTKILIVAGGTGGHLYPAIVLARKLRKQSCDILFAIQDKESIKKILKAEGFEFVEISSGPLLGQSPIKLAKSAGANIAGIFQGLGLLSRWKPDGVIGFGAYVSVPVVFAAFLKRVPILLHEQNVLPGWANRFCAVFARKVAISFPETAKFFPGKTLFIGNLIREDIGRQNREEARRSLGLAQNRFTVLVFGGSAGAKSINAAVHLGLANSALTRDSVQFLHLSGSAEETAKLKRKYGELGFSATVLDYSDRMAECYAAADLVVCRAGATTIAELIATKTPAILIPYPHAGYHQLKNARVVEKLGSGIIIPESDRLPDELSQNLSRLLNDPNELKKMSEAYDQFPISVQEAPNRLAGAVLELVQI